MPIVVVTLTAKIEKNNGLKAAIVTSGGGQGVPGVPGISGSAPQPYAVDTTTIVSGFFWIRSAPRLSAGKSIIIENDAKLIVI